MLAYQIDAGHQQKETGAAFLARLMESPMSFRELGELAEVLSSRNVLPARSIPGMKIFRYAFMPVMAFARS